MKFGIQPIERGAYVLYFAVALIVFPLAQPRPAKIEAQHRESKTVQRLHGVKHHLVVERPAEQRMRMTDDRRMRGTFAAGIQQCLQPPRRSAQEKGTNR